MHIFFFFLYLQKICAFVFLKGELSLFKVAFYYKLEVPC
ncbi:hypothetical protein AB205_0033310 [Aquarana catesbeiana]|uniref:Uncharacterized protein n=1 Tax=Aquarana catesbeiana TaxID=8400 RepID=A0A2G9RJM3_AQUCT|nr:hypothetical protein AB205_0033310 [Aquarana catesbeiana]